MAAVTDRTSAGAALATPLRLGIAGLGVASTLFLPGVEQSPHACIVAAADKRRGALDAFERKYRGRTYDSVEALCADPDIDVIWVATPNQYHCPHTVLAADNGKHVICTKPMALSVAECEEMCVAAERNRVNLLCGQTYSMSPDVQAMWTLARSGELGRLIAINSWFFTDWLIKPRVPEELDEALGGGVVYRHAPHLIETVRLLGGGRVRSVRASVGRWLPQRPCSGNFSAYLEFEDGTPATIAYNGYGYFDTSELTWGIGNRMYSDADRVRVRRALRRGESGSEDAKEGLRFGAGVAAHGPRRRQLGQARGRHTRPHRLVRHYRRELRARRHPPIAQRGLRLWRRGEARGAGARRARYRASGDDGDVRSDRARQADPARRPLGHGDARSRQCDHAIRP